MTDWSKLGVREPKPPKPRLRPVGTTPPATPGGPYAQAALNGEVKAVLDEPEGSRNHRLNKAAFKLGQLVGTGELEEETVTDALEDAGITAGLTPTETRKTIRSGVPAGKDNPRPPKPEPEQPAQVVTIFRPMTLDQVHAVFQRWLGDDYDLMVLDAVIVAAVVEKLDGDPVWLLVVSGSGAAKTETVQALGPGGAYVTSAISSEGALLSATSRKDRTKASTGGLLRKIGDRGVLVIKDVTSILSMNRDARGLVLAALREVYDGRWERNVGSDGGQSLAWDGRLVVIGAVTTAWDRAQEVVSKMGDRFVLIRLDSTKGRVSSGRHAIANTGDESAMRAELGAAIAGVLTQVNTEADLTLIGDEADIILQLADIVTLTRTGVEHDYRGDVIDAHAPEMPTRFAKQLTQLMRGGLALGLDRVWLMKMVARCAADSMPPLRMAALADIQAHPDSSTKEVRKRLGKPRSTVDRTLQALHMLGLLVCDEELDSQGRTVWRYSLSADIDAGALDRLTLSQKCR